MFYDDGAKAIASALKMNNSLSSIGITHLPDLSENNISTDGIKAISEALKINNSLVSLGNDMIRYKL